MSEENVTKNLMQKIAEITKVVERIPKNGFNEKQNYSYALESDIKDVVRKEMSDRNLTMIASEKSRTVAQLQGKNGMHQLVTLEVEYTVIDADSNELVKFTGFGDGQDFGDKAVYKAKTGALKYALTTLFLIPTGDDPESTGGKPLQGPAKITEEQVGTLEDLINTVAQMSDSDPGQVAGRMKVELKYTKELSDMTEEVFGESLKMLQKWKRWYANRLNNQQKEPNTNNNQIPWGQR